MFGWLFGVDSTNTQAGDEATLQAMDAAWQNYQSGKWTLEQYQSAITRLRANLSDNANIDSQLGGALLEGANQGIKNIGDALQGATNFSFKTLWNWIPWQIKLIGAIVLIFWIWSKFQSVNSARKVIL